RTGRRARTPAAHPHAHTRGRIVPAILARTSHAAVGEVEDGHAGTIPHVVAWNLTKRCNLACAHCYIAAGDWHDTAGELRTDEVTRIAGEILALNPAPVFILSGGEPLLRTDLETIAEFAAARGATVVVGTNGTRLDDDRIRSLMSAGVTG